MGLNKNGLVNAHVLLRCEENECDGLRDRLVGSFNEVKEAYAVTTDKDHFYVSGTAKIHPDKKNMFKRALGLLQANSDKDSRVRDVKCWLEIA